MPPSPLLLVTAVSPSIFKASGEVSSPSPRPKAPSWTITEGLCTPDPARSSVTVGASPVSPTDVIRHSSADLKASVALVRILRGVG
ncbi:hypothetical protein PR001_g25733 [Phytophthora rubi]|uniref:Uncharacterized protein n=1 Tax=Phytophthora rubi TaxID=129364 RepID=A0A6A3I1T0_9STRA|nr:hypothetical protein PR001_g25733 [Phytophthora rubi]KAE8975931.1 hypothetical protein PR002_g25459 [Phytophthora rubi]